MIWIDPESVKLRSLLSIFAVLLTLSSLHQLPVQMDVAVQKRYICQGQTRSYSKTEWPSRQKLETRPIQLPLSCTTFHASGIGQLNTSRRTLCLTPELQYLSPIKLTFSSRLTIILLRNECKWRMVNSWMWSLQEPCSWISRTEKAGNGRCFCEMSATHLYFLATYCRSERWQNSLDSKLCLEKGHTFRPLKEIRLILSKWAVSTCCKPTLCHFLTQYYGIAGLCMLAPVQSSAWRARYLGSSSLTTTLLNATLVCKGEERNYHFMFIARTTVASNIYGYLSVWHPKPKGFLTLVNGLLRTYVAHSQS